MFVSGILQSTVMTIFITKIVGSLSASESSFGWSLYLELTTLITSWFLLIIQIVVGCCCEYRYYEISNYYWWSTFLSINTLYFFGTIFINNLPLRTKDKILIKKIWCITFMRVDLKHSVASANCLLQILTEIYNWSFKIGFDMT